MRPHDYFISRSNRYSLGVDDESGQRYVSIPVTTGVVDYEEYYELDASTYFEFLSDSTSAAEFADQCRRRLHDDVLMQKPGWNRGVAT